MDTIYTQQVLGYRYTSMGVYTYYKNVWRSGRITYSTHFYDNTTDTFYAMPDSNDMPRFSVPADCDPVIVNNNL